MGPFQGTGELMSVFVHAGVLGTWGVGHMLPESLHLAIYKHVERAPLCAPLLLPALQC